MPLSLRSTGSIVAVGFGALVFGWSALNRPTPAPAAEVPAPVEAVKAALTVRVDSLLETLDRLQLTLDSSHADSARAEFRRARIQYKHIEALYTQIDPLVSGWLNGPPAEDEDDFPRPPGVTGGFQVIESTLFPGWDGESADSARATLRKMHEGLAESRTRIPGFPLHDAEVWDAARIEIARISTLGIAGFDSDPSGGAILEAAEAFDGMRWFNAALPHPDPAIESSLQRAVDYLRANPDPEKFNRLEFLVGYAGPAARAVREARSRLPVAGDRRQRAWRLEAATVFESNAFDTRAYASFDTPPPTDDLIRLGRQLFFDPRLSGPQNRSCSTCHDPNRAFTDGKVRSPLIGNGVTVRNTPTIINAAYQPVLFYDQRAASLEAQVDSVLANRDEMASSTQLAADRLRGDSAMRVAFSVAFKGKPEAGITPASIRLAIAAYLRSLTALDSRFDRAVRGDTLALTAQERSGFNLFMGKARCATCHFLPFFNSTAPPLFALSEGEIIGVPDRPVAREARLDPDKGQGGSDRMDLHLFAFKVPTLRNIALTAPYMHNGVFPTLEQVIDFYDRGGGIGIGAEVPGQTLPDSRLNLSVEEKRALVAFMGALTDTVISHQRY